MSEEYRGGTASWCCTHLCIPGLQVLKRDSGTVSHTTASTGHRLQVPVACDVDSNDGRRCAAIGTVDGLCDGIARNKGNLGRSLDQEARVNTSRGLVGVDRGVDGVNYHGVAALCHSIVSRSQGYCQGEEAA